MEKDCRCNSHEKYARGMIHPLAKGKELPLTPQGYFSEKKIKSIHKFE